jgi:tetratricopeptide (TPR) repeat protein/peroxiredoxin
VSQTNTPENTAAASAGRGSGTDLSRMMREGRSFSSHERNCCYLNTGASPSGGGRFANISAVSGLDFPDDGRAVALTDWDHDGDLDMWISNRNAPRLRLMRNEQPRGNHFLMLRLEGNGMNTNRDAIGARVEVVLGGKGEHKPLIKTLRAGEGFLAQSSKWIHFGLGEADVIDQVTVRWPGGEVEQFSDVAVDHRYQLVQGSGKVQDTGESARETVLASAPQNLQPPTQTARVPLVELLPMPRSDYAGFDGKKRQLPLGNDRLLLVNLWASWCAPCQVELKDFSERYKELQDKGIDVLALSVEGLEEDAQKGMRTARQASQGKFPFVVGLASSSLISDFQNEHNRHIPLHKKLPLPSSFLIDRQGRLSVIYKGMVSVDQLLADAAHSEGDRHARMVRSSPIGGQSIKHPRVEQVADNEAEFLRFYAAVVFQGSNRIDEVARQYADVVKFKPDSYMAQSNLGNALAKLGRNTEAITHLQKASQIKPDEAVPYFNLANILQGQGKISSAVEHYQKSLEIDPDYVGAHKNLAITMQRQGQFVEAKSHLQKALLIKPDDASIYLSLGLIAKAQRNPGKAIENYQRALELKPDYAEAYSNLGMVMHEQKKLEEAIKHYLKAIEVKPDYTEAKFNLANALYVQGKMDEALRYYNQVVTIMPKHPMVLTRLGDVYRSKGEPAKAIKYYSSVLELQQNFPLAMNGLAWIHATHPDAKWRDGAKAVALAERCCQITQNRMVPALNTLAAAYAEMGRFEDAAKWQIMAIERTKEGNQTELEERLKLYETGKPYREGS